MYWWMLIFMFSVRGGKIMAELHFSKDKQDLSVQIKWFYFVSVQIKWFYFVWYYVVLINFTRLSKKNPRFEVVYLVAVMF